MMRTCMGTESSTTKEYPSVPPPAYYDSGGDKGIFDNGDVFTGRKADDDAIRETLADVLLPEEIPGLPRHRPAGQYSSRLPT